MPFYRLRCKVVAIIRTEDTFGVIDSINRTIEDADANLKLISPLESNNDIQVIPRLDSRTIPTTGLNRLG